VKERSRPRIGMVGIGNMGMPVARRLAQAGYPLTVYARRPAVMEEARDFGATPAASLGHLGAGSDLVIVNVFSDDQVREVCLGPDGLVAHMRPSSVLVNHTTGRPSTIEKVASEGAVRKVAVLDCAMSGGPLDIAAGGLTLLVGGDIGTLEKVRPVLESYSSPVLHVGAPGDGQKVKLLNNALFGAQVALVARIEQSATELGMDPSLALSAIAECSGSSYALGVAINMGSARAMLDAARPYIQKDVAVCAEVAAELNADLGSVLAIAQEV
jgi:3-hydroxyisobutyrate dehydrogenase-like beta-hydroxyacid dehydrogenase